MRRVPELDAVRGLAALTILLYHFFPRWLPFGWAAVDLFFVLSGYLITSIIVNHHDSPSFLPRFYIRRGLRTWPIYYLSLLALLVAGPALPRPCQLAGLPYYLTYTQNIPHYWSGTVVDFSWYFKHTWTLAIEEQFYLLWPGLVLVAGRRRLVPLSATVLATSVVARACGCHWWTLLGRGDGFALGGLLVAILGSGDGPIPRPAQLGRGLRLVGAGALAYLLPMAVAGGLPDHGPPPRPAATILAINLLAFSIVGLVICQTGRPALAPLRRPRLAYLGTISYGLYLYHMIILRIRMDLFDGTGHGRNFWVEALTLAASVAAAAASWHFIERPILALKERFAYGPAAAERPPGPSMVPGRTPRTRRGADRKHALEAARDRDAPSPQPSPGGRGGRIAPSPPGRGLG